MNTKRVFAWLCVPLTLAFLTVGCATSKPPTVDTWCNPQFSPKPSDKIALTDQPNPTAQAKVLGKLLVNELQSEGFSVISADKADYLLAYVLDEAVENKWVVTEHSGYDSNPMTRPGPMTPQTDSQMVGEYRGIGGPAGTFEGDPLSVPLPDRVLRFTSHYIRLLLYTNPKTHHGNFQLVWQGNINVNHLGSTAQEQVLLKTLLSYFGKQQNGRVSLVPHD